MTMELMDMDVPYFVSTDFSADGTPMVKIRSYSAQKDGDENYDICLEKADVEELIRVLNFIKEEL